MPPNTGTHSLGGTEGGYGASWEDIKSGVSMSWGTAEKMGLDHASPEAPRRTGGTEGMGV